MSFLSTLAPWQWAIMAAVPIGIVLLYFLKLRRQPITVPSTYLWAKTIEDLHVNSLLQRLRTSPLLLLQLLAVAIAAVALLRPGYRDLTSSESRRVLLLDASASMQATDVDGDASRFEVAKRLIGAEIESMSDRDVAMLMTVSDRADVLQSFTSDRRKLREALQAARVTNRSTNIESAIRAAEGLASERREAAAEEGDSASESALPKIEMMLYSDGVFPALAEVDTSRLDPRYNRVGTAEVSNLAVVAFSVQRNDVRPGEVEAFATIANLGSSNAASSVSLRLNGELTDADEVELAAGEETGLTFQLADQDLVRLAISLDREDDLNVDNEAYATLAPTRTVSVLLVSPGNTPLELALSTGEAEKICVLETVDPSYLKGDAYKARAATGIDELIIYDRCRPDTMPMTNTFFIGAIPPEGWQQSEKQSQVLLVDIDRSHPIMRYLDLFSLLIAEGRTLTPPPGAADLLVSETGPVLSLGPRRGFEDLVLGFEILSSLPDGGTAYNTDWQVQRSWPVFVFNAVRYLTGAADAGARLSHPPGSVVTISTDRRQGELSIRTPDGTVTFVKPDESGRLTYAVGDTLGIYELEDEKRMIDLFAVNMFDRQESRIESAEAVQLGYSEVTSDGQRVASRREYWRLLLLAMLGVLTVEWWYYSRRLG
ncbi:MAG: VWA domain-containing protein [Planctomycetaceae bacterium]